MSEVLQVALIGAAATLTGIVISSSVIIYLSRKAHTAVREEVQAIHIQINSGFTELMRLHGEAEREKGVREGRELGIVERAARVAESERVEDRIAGKKVDS